MLPGPPPPPPHSQPPALPLPPGARPTPANRPLAHSGSAAQSLTFRTGVRSHVLADSPPLPLHRLLRLLLVFFPPHLRPAASAAARRGHTEASRPPHRRTGGLPLGPGGEGGEGAPRFLLQRHSACAPARGRREKAGERQVCVRVAADGGQRLPPGAGPSPGRSPPPRCARGWGRGEPAARRGRNAPTGGRGVRARGGTLGCLRGAGLGGRVCRPERPQGRGVGCRGWEAGEGGRFVIVAGGDFPGHLRARGPARRPLPPAPALDGRAAASRPAGFREGCREARLPVAGRADFTVLPQPLHPLNSHPGLDPEFSQWQRHQICRPFTYHVGPSDKWGSALQTEGQKPG